MDPHIFADPEPGRQNIADPTPFPLLPKKKLCFSLMW